MYTVLEIQDNTEQVSVLSYSFQTEAEAHQKFYEIMFYASSSTVPIHSAAIIANGFCIRSDAMDRTIEETEE